MREVAVPALFTVLGGALGFFTSQFRDDLKARRAKESFLRAVGMELDALSIQLDDSLREVKESTERVKIGSTGPHFAGKMRTAVFKGQIGKLRDVDDKLMIELIHFYSDLGTVEQAFYASNDCSAEYSRTTSDVQRPIAQGRLLSTLIVLQQQIVMFTGTLGKLRAKLPPAEPKRGEHL